MGSPEDFRRSFEERTGVLKAMLLTDEQFDSVWAVESEVKTQTLSDYENLGFDVLSKRMSKMCIFIDDTFQLKKHSNLKMIDSRGTVLGTTLTPEEIESHQGRDDIVWLSKDFIMYPNVEAVGKEKFVLYPYEFPEMSNEIPGFTNIVGTSPTPSADRLLKAMGEMPMTTRLFTFILGFDYR